jgi:cell wall-associated NlpC family hydrolase
MTRQGDSMTNAITSWMRLRTVLLLALTALVSACSTTPTMTGIGSQPPQESAQTQSKRGDITFFSLGLIDTGYRFGGKNPEAGFDCSGMVSYVFREAANIRVSGSAANIAKRGKEIDKEQLQPGDLVFFNTLGRSYSHVGIYIGDGRFIHAPSTNGKVRIDQISNKYWAKRFEEARSYFN